MPKSVSKSFSADPDTTMTAAQRAIVGLGYKIDSIDRAAMMISFKTGLSWRSWAGQEMTLIVCQAQGGFCEVTLSGRMNQSGVYMQVYDWGEAGVIAGRVLDALEVQIDNLQNRAQSNTQTEIHTLRKFRIVGVDSATHYDTSLVVEAATEANAKVKAELRGVIVTSVTPIS